MFAALLTNRLGPAAFLLSSPQSLCMKNQADSDNPSRIQDNPGQGQQ